VTAVMAAYGYPLLSKTMDWV